jgi:hypothetical protein
MSLTLVQTLHATKLLPILYIRNSFKTSIALSNMKLGSKITFQVVSALLKKGFVAEISTSLLCPAASGIWDFETILRETTENHQCDHRSYELLARSSSKTRHSQRCQRWCGEMPSSQPMYLTTSWKGLGFANLFKRDERLVTVKTDE